MCFFIYATYKNILKESYNNIYISNKVSKNKNSKIISKKRLSDFKIKKIIKLMLIYDRKIKLKKLKIHQKLSDYFLKWKKITKLSIYNKLIGKKYIIKKKYKNIPKIMN